MLSLPTPPKCFAASVLATLHAAFARKVRARPSGCSTLEAIWVHLRYGPVPRSPSFLDGFVNRLQDFQFPSFLLFKLRGFDFYPGGTHSHCSCQPSLDAHLPFLIERGSQLPGCRRTETIRSYRHFVTSTSRRYAAGASSDLHHVMIRIPRRFFLNRTPALRLLIVVEASTAWRHKITNARLL